MTELKRVSRSFDELLDAVPGLRRLRSLNADWLRVLHDRRLGECTWCGSEMPKGRQVWCGDVCEVAFYTRCSWTYAARLVFDRDRGICRECGTDTVANEREAKALKKVLLTGRCPKHVNLFDWRQQCLESATWFTARGFSRGRWREVDHILPVCNGGGLCTLDNLRLLCGVCHHEHTKQLAAQNAKARKDAA